jgi:hypothetical protein
LARHGGTEILTATVSFAVSQPGSIHQQDVHKNHAIDHIVSTFFGQQITFPPSEIQKNPSKIRRKTQEIQKLTTTHHKTRRVVLCTAKWSGQIA